MSNEIEKHLNILIRFKMFPISTNNETTQYQFGPSS